MAKSSRRGPMLPEPSTWHTTQCNSPDVAHRGRLPVRVLVGMIATLTEVFANDSVLLVFAVMAVAAALGSIRLRGVALGPAAALFAGLGVGAIDESLSGGEGLAVLRELGLVLFTYTLGIAAGPAFFAGLRRGGAAAAAVTVALIGGLAAVCALAGTILDLSAADRSGLFAGTTTNTPALQAASEARATATRWSPIR